MELRNSAGDVQFNLQHWRAFSVHLLTASGAFWALLAIVAAASGRWVDMFAWLGLALFVDGIDGPIARKVDIKHVLPNWSGDMLDSVIDYATYVLIPAFALHQSGMIEHPWSLIAAALIVITSAVYYADTRMKTTDNFFRGFPVTWNMVVFTLFAVDAASWPAFLFVVFCAGATFLPLKFLHPVRVKRLRPLNLAMFAVWSVLGIVALAMSFQSPAWVELGILLSGAYLFFVGIVLQGFDRLRGVNAD